MLGIKGMLERKASALLGLCRASLGYLMCFWFTCQDARYLRHAYCSRYEGLKKPSQAPDNLMHVWPSRQPL